MKNITNYVINDLDLKFEAKSSKEMKDPFDGVTGKSSVQKANKAAKELEEIAVNAKDVDPKDVTYSRSGAKDSWNVDPPFEDWEKTLAECTFEDENKNVQALVRKFEKAIRYNNKQGNFYVVGERGWAKTATITRIAKQYGYHVVVVYLDKAEPEDLGGMPIVIKNADGSTETKYNLPPWAKYIYKNPKKKFLLFFDEMNQASGGVTNALMPIVLEHVICGIKFDNILVGAAGNRSDENSSVADIEQENKPLASRFAPIIYWETGTEDAWKGAFDYFYEIWGDKYSLVLDKLRGGTKDDKGSKVMTYWKNPRELEQILMVFIDTAINSPRKGVFAKEDVVKDTLLECVSESLIVNGSVTADIDEIARFIYKFIENDGKVDKNGNPLDERIKVEGRKAGTDFDDIEKTAINMLNQGYYVNDKNEKFMVDGKVISGDGKKYFVTLENIITECLPPWVFTNIVEAEGKDSLLNEYGDPKDEEAEKEWKKLMKENKDTIIKYAEDRLEQIKRYMKAEGLKIEYETNAKAREANNTKREQDRLKDPAEWNELTKQKPFGLVFITMPAIMNKFKYHKEEMKIKPKDLKKSFDKK